MKRLFSIFLIIIFFVSCSNDELVKKDKEIKDYETKNKELEYTIKLKEQEIEYLKKDIDRMGSELKLYKEEVEKLKNLEKEYAVLKTERDALVSRFDEKTKDIQKALEDRNKQVEEKSKLVDTLSKELEKMKADNQKLVADLETKKNEIENLKKSIESEKKMSVDYQNNMKTLEEQIVKLNQSLQEKEKIILDLKSEIKVLKDTQELMKKESESLKQSLSLEIKKGNVIVQDSFNSITVLLMEKVMFGKAQISITKSGEEILKNIANTLSKIKDKEVFVIGHADSDPVVDPIISKIYPTNWEFSVMRAVMVVRYFTEVLGLNPSLFTAAGRSSFHPIVLEKNEEDKSLNRRTEILIFPKYEIKKGN
ncbi:MAG TPA: OmpA family protein [Spirochaetota bacterium]|nr:OmpA family protein [Spirochaetota bacterium]HOM38931.1 OmpA family protein [Spirochaetota bacterium]HPQ49187.1 OmpA family protein [Spirochaetota bacterium]